MEGTSVYTKIEYKNAVETKKLLLMAQMNCLNTISRLQAYRESRKKEQMLKMKMKNDFETIKKDIIKIVYTYPEIRRIGPKPEERPKNRVEITKTMELNNQLSDIKSRLEALSQKQ